MNMRDTTVRKSIIVLYYKFDSHNCLEDPKMTAVGHSKYFGFVWPSRYIASPVLDMARRSESNLVFDVTSDDKGQIIKRLLELGTTKDVVDLRVFPEQLSESWIDSLVSDSVTSRLWVELSGFGVGEDVHQVARFSESYGSDLSVIPILSSAQSIVYTLQSYPKLRHLAIKGNEAAGFVGSETSLSLLCAVRDAIRGRSSEISFFLWGGIGTPEAAAAALALGTTGIVFESLHWLTDVMNLPEESARKILRLRPDHTEIIGLNIGVPVRVFNKGNSKAVRDLRNIGREFCGVKPVPREERQVFAEEVRSRLVHPLESNLGADQVIPLGIEAAFCSSFIRNFGTSTGDAVSGFISSTLQCFSNCLANPLRLKNSPASAVLGTRYPIIQGAMSWITDEPDFALRVAQAGALPTIAMGVLSPSDVEGKLGSLPKMMGSEPYAVNVITLDENPYKVAHFDWILKTKPRFVVIAAGDPSSASRFLEIGIEVIYVSPTEELLKLAFNSGIRFVVCEGNEAGGHVGPYSTLTLAQRVLELKRQEPELFSGRTVILAGGIFDRHTAFLASMLGADAIQVGTAYLATEEIVSTGALSNLYQKRILEASPGETLITGEEVGLRVRSLKSPMIETLCDLEREYFAGRADEASFRRKVESLTAGSLYTAAKARDVSCGTSLDDEACHAQGQFMSGASAGLIHSRVTLEELHSELMAGPVASQIKLSGSLLDTAADHLDRGESRHPHRWMGTGDREMAATTRIPEVEPIVITAMSVLNSLGSDCEEVLQASLARKSGIVTVPSSRWDHGIYFDPRPRAQEKTYCDVGAFLNVEISRKELGIAPHDFRTMTGATKITMLLAQRVIEESGILKSDIPRERISVLISQNSGEAAGTLQDMIIRGSTDKIVQAAKRVLSLNPEQEKHLESEIKKGRLGVDDTTLLGRLNCSAGGFICNKYGFMGPSFSVSAACATSLVALYTAVQLIRNGIIDAALVGGGEEYLSPMHFMEFSALGALAGLSGKRRSPREMSRPFEAERDGMVLGEGGGMLLVERRSVALKRGARVQAYLTSMGASNNHLGMVESSSLTQELAIAASFKGLQYGPELVDFVECHATGTKQGDLEEVRALQKFQDGKRQRSLVLSSFKSQIGHTLGASGINSLIRGVAAMQHGAYPPTMNYETPDPDIGLERAGMILLNEPEEWSRRNGLQRRFQVNAFGFGGSNYVVQIEEAQDESATVLVDVDTPSQTDGPINDRRSESLTPEGIFFFQGDLSGQPHRIAVLADTEQAAYKAIHENEVLRNGSSLGSKRSRALARQGIFLGDMELPRERLAFVFPGQGSHYAGMGKELYENVPLVRSWMDRAAKLADFDLLNLLFYDREEDLQKTRWQQPALFTLEYAMVQYFTALGIRPTALAGHSLGELTALCLAGVYSFEDGFRLVNKRAVCMDKACSLNVDPGVMLACDAPLDRLKDMVKAYPQTYITNVNSPRQTVVGGETEAVKLLGLELKGLGFRSTLLRVSMAFHSPIMSCIRDELEEFVSTVDFHSPEIPVISNTTAKPFPSDPQEIKRIVMAHLESPVLWLQDTNLLRQEYGVRFFVEVGPREILSNLIKDTLEDVECIQTCLPSAEFLIFKTAVAQCYTQGHVEIPFTVRRLPGDFWEAPSKNFEPASSVPRQSYSTHHRSQTQQINDIVQQHINAFVLDSFGKFIKPAILKSIVESVDTHFTEKQLDEFVGLSTGDAEISLKDAGGVERKDGQTSGREERHDAMPLEALSNQGTQEAPVSGSDITETVIRLIMEATGYERDEIEPTMDLREDLSIRSSRLPVIMDAVESHFGIKIELEDFMDVRTIGDIADRIAMVIERQSHQDTSVQVEPREECKNDKPREECEESQGPVRRMVFGEVPVHAADIQLVEINPTEPIIVLAPSAENGLAREVGDILRRDYGANIHSWGFLGEKGESDPLHFDLTSEAGLADALSAIKELPDSPAGLVIVLDRKIEQVAGGMPTVPDLLAGLFGIMRVFLQSPAKKFLLVVRREDESETACDCLFEGLIGVLLTGSLEVGYVLFRAVALAEGAQLAEAIRGALNKTILPVQLVCRGDRMSAIEGHSSPLMVGSRRGHVLEKEDVIVFSGGGYGITNHLAEKLASYGCRVVLLGRTSLDDIPAPLLERPSKDLSAEFIHDTLRAHYPDSNEESLLALYTRVSSALKITDNIRDLQVQGLDVSYFSCDVTDFEALSGVFDRVVDLYGRIDGVVHGAGILKDALIKHMTRQDFIDAVKVKFVGAWNLFKVLGERKIKFFACLSSAAAVQGNLGQSNYAAGNRMMSALMPIMNRSGTAAVCKSLMLPPIEGVGMAETTEIRSLMKRAHIGYLHVEELTELFWREMLLDNAAESSVLLFRTLPDLKTAPLATFEWESAGRMLKVETAVFHHLDFPMIDAVRSVDLKNGLLQASRKFSTERDLWINDHKPFSFLRYPLVSAIMVIETMLEACGLLYPLLKPVTVRDIWFFDVIECPPNSSQEILISCRTLSRSQDGVVCQTEISTGGDQSPHGARSQSSPHYRGQVVMSPFDASLPVIGDRVTGSDHVAENPLITRSQIMEQYEIRTAMKDRYRVIESIELAEEGRVRASTVCKNRQDFADPADYRYHYPTYLLEALLQSSNFYLVARDPSTVLSLIPYHIGEVVFTRACRDNETIAVEGRVLEEGDEGITWEAWGVDQSGATIMKANKIMFRWFSGSRT